MIIVDEKSGVVSYENTPDTDRLLFPNIQQGSGGASRVDVEGSAPVIDAADSTFYTAGEVSTIAVTAPASGCFGVSFRSGAAPAVLTTTGVIWPEWFNPAALEANRIYEISVMDGRGLVASWPTAAAGA